MAPDDTSNAVTSVGKLTRAEVEFRKKRFKLLWKARISNVRPGNVNVEIRRQHVVSDSFAAFGRFTPTELQQKLVVQFADEEGIDSGGLTKDWCLLLSRKALSTRAGLFTVSPNGFYDIKPSAASRALGRKSLRLLGTFVGKAVFDRVLVDMPLSAGVCKFVTRAPVTVDDLADTDPELQKGLEWTLSNDITDVVDATFSVTVPRAQADAYAAADDSGAASALSTARRRRASVVGGVGEGVAEWDAFGAATSRAASPLPDKALAAHPPPPPPPGGSADKELVTVDLIEGGRDIEVTEENKRDYVQAMVEWRLWGQCKVGLEAFRAGIMTMLPQDEVRSFSVDELRALMNGRAEVNLAAMRRTTNFTGGLDRKAKTVRWLWRSLNSFSPEDRAAFLRFATGTDRVPLDGFDPPFTLTGSDLPATALPRAHTCFNQCVMPQHESYEQLREKLLFAMHNSEGFLLA